MADYYNIFMTVADLGTCWIPGWARKRKNQSFADNNGMKLFHDALKTSGTTLMTDKDVVLNRRAKLIVCA